MWKLKTSLFLELFLLPTSCLPAWNQSQCQQFQSCSSAQQQRQVPGPKKGKTMKLEAQDSGRSLTLQTHDSFRIELAENPTTGYRWQILESGSPVLRISQDSFARGKSPGVGAGGTRILQFVAENAGAASVHLGYARLGDPASQKNEFVLHVQVNLR